MFKKIFNKKSNSGHDAPAAPQTLAQRIEAAHAFFDSENLANLLIKYEGEIGLVVIDVQKKYCDPAQWANVEEVDAVSKRIKLLAPAFRKAGIPIYAVYLGNPTNNANAVDFHEFFPEPEDTLVAKNTRSAFEGGNIKDILEKDHKKLLLACGVYLDQCVRATVTDAVRNGFDVCLLRDLTGDHPKDMGHTEQSLKSISDQGIAILPSDVVLKAVQIAINAQAPKL